MTAPKKITESDIEAAFAKIAVEDIRLCNVGNVIADNPALGPRIMDVAHYSAPTIQKVLKALGLPVPSTENINKHRKGNCRCPKESTDD